MNIYVVFNHKSNAGGIQAFEDRNDAFEYAGKDLDVTCINLNRKKNAIDVEAIKKYEEMMGTVSESIKTEWREFSYIASELHRRKIETIINPERGDIQLRDEKTGKTLTFGSLLEVKAFALGLDWGIENADNMAFCGLHSPICKEEWK